MRSCYHRYVLQENKSDFKPISDGVAIGCVLQERFKCTVDPDTSLNQGPNKTHNVPINTVSPPYTQISPQAAILAMIPNEEMSMDFKIKVCIEFISNFQLISSYMYPLISVKIKNT